MENTDNKTPTPVQTPVEPQVGPESTPSRLYSFFSSKRNIVVFVVLFAVLGTVLLALSHAQTSTNTLIRLSKNGYHMYTTSASEASTLTSSGWKNEGSYPFTNPAASNPVPVYRLRNSKTTDHFFTTSATERDSAVAKYGYTSEGVGFSSATSATVPSGYCRQAWYRLVGPTGHFYTASTKEVSSYQASGWTLELGGKPAFNLDATCTSSTPAPSPTPTPTPTPTPAPSPIPASATLYKSLTPKGSATGIGSNGVLSATVNALTKPTAIGFAAGTYQFYNFDDPTTTPDNPKVSTFGIWFRPTSVSAIYGSGVGSTIFQMAPNSSTRASSVPPQSTFPTGTNQLSLMRIDQSPVLSNFTLLGTNQGHLYNGLLLYKTINAQVTNVLVKGIPGNNSANPGETFFMNLYSNSGTTLNNVEIDGKNSAGQKVGASGIGINGGSNTTFNNLYVHDMLYGHAVAASTTSNITYNQPRFIGNNQALNFERVSGTVNINKPYFHNNLDSAGKPSYDIAIANDQSSGTFNIYDPVYDGAKLTVRVTGFMGNPRTQNPSAVKLYVGGVLRQDLMTLTVTN